MNAGRGDDQRVLANPIAGYIFTRLTNAVWRLPPSSFSPFKKRDGEYVRDDNGNRIPEDPKRAALLEDWLWSTVHPDDAMVFGPEVTDIDVEQLKAIDPLVKAQAILKPVFEQADFEWTDDVAAEIFDQGRAL
ncbi:hypothetical protein [Tunturiibacter gelidiferens]|uniref:hypothetical protein n=1 Tax=Tunturiibacter gelidiferens TaxID=3069689 RepID=UPI003D9B721E